MAYEEVRASIPFLVMGILWMIIVAGLFSSKKNPMQTHSTVYVVIAHLANKQGILAHTYTVTATTDLEKATLSARMEEYNTNKRYVCDIIAYTGDSQTYIKRI